MTDPTGSSPSPARVARATAAVTPDPDADPLDLADALWLCQFLPGSPRPEPAALRQKKDVGTSSSNPSPTPPPFTNPADVAATGGEGETRTAATELRVPVPPAVARTRDLARSVHPLGRRRPSPTRREVDVDQTVRQAADAGDRPWDVVERPVADRWLRAAVVVDTSASAAVWGATARGLIKLLAESGVFAQFQVWFWDTDASSPGVRKAREATSTRPTNAILAPGGPQVVLVLTDAAGQQWQSPSQTATRVLTAWASAAHVAVVQLLPERLWDQTGLSAADLVSVSGVGPAPRNGKLSTSKPAVGPRFPVFALEARSIGRWAGLVAAAPRGLVPAYVFSPSRSPRVTWRMPTSSTTPRSAEVALDAFWATASPTARRLAGLLAASAPYVSLPILRLVSRALVPDATNLHEAEVLTGGLLQETARPVDGDPEKLVFQFAPGVRDLLADGVPVDVAVRGRSEIAAKIDQLSAAGGATTGAAVPEAGGSTEVIAGRTILKVDADLLFRLRGTTGTNGLRDSQPSLFISCVSAEFESPAVPFAGLRGRLTQALRRAQCDVSVPEDFHQTDADSILKTAAYIRSCNAAIHIVGAQPGSLPGLTARVAFLHAEPQFLDRYPDLRERLGDCSDLTYTQWWAFLALHHGVPLFVYTTAEGGYAQAEHLGRLRLGRRFATRIGATADLLGQLVGDLSAVLSMPRHRVYVSATSSEFEAPGGPFPGLRSRLRDALTRAGCHAVTPEMFRTGGVGDVLQQFAEYVRGCDLMLHLVGESAGSVAHPRAVADFLASEPTFLDKYPDLRAALGDCAGLTYSQWEAFLALHYGVRLLVYATIGQYPHLDRLRVVRVHPAHFRDEADLLGLLVGDLRATTPAPLEVVQRIAKPRFLHHTAEFFLGREAELKQLDDAWTSGTRVLSVIARGGVGKTALLSLWIQTRFIARNWKDARGSPSPLAYLDWSFHEGAKPSLEETAVRAGSVGDFFEQALTHFGDTDVTKSVKGVRLASLVRQQRTLFVLDGLEPLQSPPGSPTAGRLLDPDLRDFVTLLARQNPGMLVLTSRQALSDLDGLTPAAVRQLELGDLPTAAGVQLLRRLKVGGTDAELEAATKKLGHHALSLTLCARFLFDAFPIDLDAGDGMRGRYGDIRRIDQVQLPSADALTPEDRHRSAWRVLEAYERWLGQEDGDPKSLAVLRLMGLFDRSATAASLAALRAEPAIPGLTDALVGMAGDEWSSLLKRLERAQLIKLPAEADGRLAIDSHPLIREYFAQQLRTSQAEAFRAAHARLFDHLCATTPHRPDTLDGLQPLYQAVVHGCLAGRHQEAVKEVYYDRIQRGGEHYSTNQIGAYGADLAAATAFFDEPWTRVTPNLSNTDRAWVLNEAGYNLRALGRLTEAIQPMRVGLDMAVAERQWNVAAVRAQNLGELERGLGRLADAEVETRRAVEYADQSGNNPLRAATRAAAADALHDSGRYAEAGVLFADAERFQREADAGPERLNLQAGYDYAAWIFGPAGRATWRTVLGLVAPGTGDNHAPACAEIDRHGESALRWASVRRASLLDLALGHLILARVGLVRAVLAAPLPQPQLDLPHVVTALSLLRAAGTMHELPRGLLTAALYHFIRGEHDLTRTHLAECQHLAERGPMPLFLADVHLHRARMFRDKAELAKAAKLIRDLGYGRRYDELADAEAALR